jgi:hypothetical protein
MIFHDHCFFKPKKQKKLCYIMDSPTTTYRRILRGNHVHMAIFVCIPYPHIH